jgi:hypothetical protein
MFRDRVVSMEQTQEIGEKNIELLTALATEALEGFGLVEHGLEHEQDLYFLSLAHPGTGELRRVAFTRMVLSDANRLPAVVADAAAPIRARIVGLIRSQAARPRILVSLRELLNDEEKTEADEIEAEWRKKHEAALAAKMAEEERRQRERQRQKQQEEARRHAQREKRPRAAQSGGQTPAAPPGAGGGRRGGRRGRGGQNRAGGEASGAAQQAQQPQQPQQPRHGQAPRPPRPQVSQGPDAGAPRPEGGGGGRRRRRRGRGRGPGSGGAGNAGGAPPPPSAG